MPDERLRDLVRYARQFLHDQELISDQEYAELCADNGPERVARLQTYDQMRADIADLREKIEQLELLEARSAQEAAMERKRVEFWRGECEERTAWIGENWWIRGDFYTHCRGCGRTEGRIKNGDGHGETCAIVRLKQMPEEPTE